MEENCISRNISTTFTGKVDTTYHHPIKIYIFSQSNFLESEIIKLNMFIVPFLANCCCRKKQGKRF